MGWRPTLKHQDSRSPVAASLEGWGRKGCHLSLRACGDHLTSALP